MKKLFTTLACAFALTAAFAGEGFSGKLTIAAGSTNATADVALVKTFGAGYLGIARISAVITAGSGTGVVSFVQLDNGLETALATSATAMSATAPFISYPTRPVTSTMAGYVVTNDVLVASTTTVTAQVPYVLPAVRVRVIQPVAATATTYVYTILTQ